MAHAYRGGAVRLAHVLQSLVDIGGAEVTQPCRADRGQERFEHVLVLADGLRRSAGEAVVQPVLGSLADRVVRRRGLGSGVHLGVQLGEPVGDDGLGLAGDLAAIAAAVVSEAEGDDAAPAAGAVAVPEFVSARPRVVEVHRVEAPSSSCGLGAILR